ncbi:MAG: adenylyltransferase/cytidyltransferase family protein [Candidatus Pacearchaeota archaeon]
MVRVCISGYFDPLHVGHLEYIKKSKELGDKLIVIVNNDRQAVLKKGKSFMSEGDRVEILKAIKWVDEVVLSIDEDRSVCKTLEKVNPDIFANGGDRHNYEVPEAVVCKKLGIKMVDGVCGQLRQSSVLIKNYEEK